MRFANRLRDQNRTVKARYATGNANHQYCWKSNASIIISFNFDNVFSLIRIKTYIFALSNFCTSVSLNYLTVGGSRSNRQPFCNVCIVSTPFAAGRRRFKTRQSPVCNLFAIITTGIFSGKSRLY